jgi:hypothetical protein
MAASLWTLVWCFTHKVPIWVLELVDLRLGHGGSIKGKKKGFGQSPEVMKAGRRISNGNKEVDAEGKPQNYSGPQEHGDENRLEEESNTGLFPQPVFCHLLTWPPGPSLSLQPTGPRIRRLYQGS